MKITVKELKEMLEAYKDDKELFFGRLEFYRLKDRGDDVVQVEFRQTVYLNEQQRVLKAYSKP